MTTNVRVSWEYYNLVLRVMPAVIHQVLVSGREEVRMKRNLFRKSLLSFVVRTKAFHDKCLHYDARSKE